MRLSEQRTRGVLASIVTILMGFPSVQRNKVYAKVASIELVGFAPQSHPMLWILDHVSGQSDPTFTSP